MKIYLFHWIKMFFGMILYPIYLYVYQFEIILSLVGYYAFYPEPRWKLKSKVKE